MWEELRQLGVITRKPWRAWKIGACGPLWGAANTAQASGGHLAISFSFSRVTRNPDFHMMSPNFYVVTNAKDWKILCRINMSMTVICLIARNWLLINKMCPQPGGWRKGRKLSERWGLEKETAKRRRCGNKRKRKPDRKSNKLRHFWRIKREP